MSTLRDEAREIADVTSVVDIERSVIAGMRAALRECVYSASDDGWIDANWVRVRIAELDEPK